MLTCTWVGWGRQGAAWRVHHHWAPHAALMQDTWPVGQQESWRSHLNLQYETADCHSDDLVKLHLQIALSRDDGLVILHLKTAQIGHTH